MIDLPAHRSPPSRRAPPDGLARRREAPREEPELPLAVRTSRRYGSARLTLFEPVITAIYPGTYDPVTTATST